MAVRIPRRSVQSIALAAVAALTPAAFGQATGLTRGQSWLVRNGLHLTGMVANYDNFHLETYQNANYTAINWMWDSNVSLHGTAPGAMPWMRWVGSQAQMPPVGAEAPYMSKMIAMQIGDEQNFNDPTIRQNTAAWMASARQQHPNALLYVNNYGSQITDPNFSLFVNEVNPDLISFDTYPYVQGSQPAGGSPWNWYSDMWRYRYYALAHDKALGQYRQTFHDGYWRDPSESELRLNTFGALAYNVKLMSDFTYNTGNSSFFTAPGGDNNPKPLYYSLAQINKEARNLGPALVRLTPLVNHPTVSAPVTDQMIIRGKHLDATMTAVSNQLPWGYAEDPQAPQSYSDWVFQRNDPYLTGWGVTNLGTLNNGLKGDVLLSWFKPVDEWFDGDDWNNEVYVMVTNGLADMNGSAADTRQQIILDFAVTAGAPLTIQKVNRETGAVEEIALPLFSGKRRWTLQLDGGTAELFKFKTGAPFVGTLPPDAIWNNLGSSTFQTAGNWDIATAPSGNYFAHFGSTTAGSGPTYTVSFGGNATSKGAFVHRDNVAWDLNGNTYTLSGFNGVDSLIVGMRSGEAGSLTLTDGTLSVAANPGYYSQIGKAAGSVGTMTLGNAAIWNNATPLLVGKLGTGTLNVNAGSTASLTNVYLGGSATAAGGVGVLNVGGGTATISGTLKVWNTGGAAPGGSRLNLSSGTLNVGALDTNGNPARFNWTGGTFNLTNSNLALGDAGPIGSSLSLGVGKTLKLTMPAAVLTVDPSANLTVSGGTLNAATLLNNGAFAQSSGSTTLGAISGSGTVNVTGGMLAATGIRQQSLAVTGSGIVTISPSGGAAGLVAVNSLSVEPSAKLDLNDNDLVVSYGTDASPFSTIRSLVLQGLSSSVDPAKTGIISSTGQADGDKVLALVDNALAGLTTFAGGTVSSTAVLGKYTYFGDMNLDGQVTGDDYPLIDLNLNTTPDSGVAWLKGDANLDGSVTGDDYPLIDLNLGKGVGESLSAAAMPGEGAVAVPEPAVLSLLALLSALPRRRRR